MEGREATASRSGLANGNGDRAKALGTTLRSYLDLDRAEGRRRSEIKARDAVFRRMVALADVLAIFVALEAPRIG